MGGLQLPFSQLKIPSLTSQLRRRRPDKFMLALASNLALGTAGNFICVMDSATGRNP